MILQRQTRAMTVLQSTLHSDTPCFVCILRTILVLGIDVRVVVCMNMAVIYYERAN